MLPQTNLQLYRVLLEQGAADAELARVRFAYDLARQLFSRAYRPSHKPFVAHLVGTAGTLALWGEPIATVVAGLLHSTYLFGDFGDGCRGVTPWRRQIVSARIGNEAEQLIDAYTRHQWKAPLEETAAALAAGRLDRTVVVLKLADLCDECSDAGPAFAAGKPLEYGLPADAASRQRVLELARQVAGPTARAHFARAFADFDACQPPADLVTADRSFHVVGDFGETGSSLVRQWNRFAHRLRRKRAA